MQGVDLLFILQSPVECAQLFLAVFEGSRGVSVEFVGDARVNGGDRVDGGVGERREVVHFEIDHCSCGVAFSKANMRIMRFL